MSEARTGILARIRSELGSATLSETGTSEEAYARLPRAYQQAGRLTEQARLAMLLDRLADYDADVIATEESRLAEAVALVLQQHGDLVLLVAADVPPAWTPADGPEVLREPASRPLEQSERTRAQAVLTTCAGAIAETGTLLLAHDGNAGRRALSLLPDHHLCVLRREDIVETVSEGLALLDDAKCAPITTTSGPSATADIEMTRIRGVHGPRRLTVLLI